MKIINKIWLLLVVGLLATGLSGCNLFRVKIDTSPYITSYYDGIDGYTSLEMNLNKDQMKSDYLEKIKDKKLENYEALFATMQLQSTKVDNLNNGDVVVLSIEWDEELAKAAGVLLQNTEVELTIEGLEQGELIDLFQDIAIKVQGIAPYTVATIENNSTNPYVQSLQYVVEPAMGFYRGDVLKITCNATKESARASHYVYLEDEKNYNTSRVDEYLSNIEQLDYLMLSVVAQNALDTVKAEAENNQHRMLYALTGSKNYLFQYNKEWVDSIELYEAKLLTGDGVNPETGESVPINRLYLIFKAYVTNADYGNDGYFCFEYTNLISKSDGSNEIHYDNQENRYLCDQDYNKLMEKVVQKQKGTYIEQNVDILLIDVQNN